MWEYSKNVQGSIKFDVYKDIVFKVYMIYSFSRCENIVKMFKEV